MAGKPTTGDSRSLAGTEESRRITRAATPRPATPRECPGGDPTYEMLSIGGGRRSPPETARHERFHVVSYVQESRNPPLAVKPLGEFETHARNRTHSFFKNRPDQAFSLSRKGKEIWSNSWDFTSNDLRWQRKLAHGPGPGERTAVTGFWGLCASISAHTTLQVQPLDRPSASISENRWFGGPICSRRKRTTRIDCPLVQ